MSATDAAAPTPQELVAQEQAGSTRAGAAAIVGGLALFAGGAINALVTADAPRVYVVEALREAAGRDIGRPALLGDRIEFLADNALGLVGSAALTSIGWLATALALAYLLNAARARRSETPRFTIGLLLAGGIGLAVAVLATYLALAIAAGAYGGPDETSESARDVLQGPVLLGSQLLRTLATLAMALAITFTALNAMRAGLLTRFLGILGIIVGVLLVFPIGVGLPIVQTFWLIAVGLLILGRSPGGRRPPAWEAGVAVPWPSQQELREQRERAAGRGGGDGAVEQQPERPRTDAPSPAASKKKRKRRS